jgi:MYXO-CTERM domain-containing protein
VYSTWRPGTTQLGGHRSGGLYQDGSRFSLAGWSASEWETFFGGAVGAFSQVYGQITQKAAPPPPVPIVPTPIGGVPTWASVGLVAVGGLFLLSRRR